MNGTNDFDWTPKEQIKKERKKLYIRFALSIILSNILVAIIFHPQEKAGLDDVIGYSSKKDYAKLLLPLENYIPINDDEQEYKINLFDQAGNPFITDAYLLSMALSHDNENIFVVEIPINQIEKFHLLTEEQKPLKAYPHDPNIQHIVGGKVYEIQF